MYSAKRTANVLRAVGMHPKYKGYAYMHYILMHTGAAGERVCLSTFLYPMVTKEFGVSVSAVERCLRFAIKRTWETGNQEALQHIFGAYDTSYVPSVSECVAVMAECLRCGRIG